MIRGLILVLVLAGCAAEPVGSLPHVGDLYPDELQATVDAWNEIKGFPVDVETIRNATVTFGTPAEVTKRCHAGTRLTGCTTMRDDGSEINVMLVTGEDFPWIVCHELSHAIRGTAIDTGNGDPHHTDPEIWGQDGVVNTAARIIALERAIK